MTEEHGYNGWKNYETWVMALWIDNDQGSYELARKLADLAHEARAKLPDDSSSSRTVTGILADSLKDWQEDSKPDLEASVWSDLLSAAFSEVDWYEIADNYLSE